MAPSYRSQAQETALVLFWVATALLGIYTVTVLAAAVPLHLLQPAWIERVCGIVRGGVSFPLMAVALLLLADILNDSQEEPGYLTVIRRLACFAAIGFFLMIPLQTWAGIAALQQTNANEQAQLRPYTRALAAIRTADSQELLLQALASIPGSPSNLGGSLKASLPQVREQLVRQIEPQVNARLTQLEALQSSRWQEGFLRWFKDGVVTLFSAISFAAIGRFAVGRSSLLGALLQWSPKSKRSRPKFSIEDLMPPGEDPIEALPSEIDRFAVHRPSLLSSIFQRRPKPKRNHPHFSIEELMPPDEDQMAASRPADQEKR